MSKSNKDTKICAVIGASHAGVNFAFALRKEGWDGDIILFDKDQTHPYHRPPLSKAYLTTDNSIEKYFLKSRESYEKERIILRLGITIHVINRVEKYIELDSGAIQPFDKLVIATGARPIIPPIRGIDTASHLYPLRTAADVENIRKAIIPAASRRVVVIGGGYIGLEIAASIRKLGATVTILEREERILARVTTPEMSQFFHELHTKNQVQVLTSKNVVSIDSKEGLNTVVCSDDTVYKADVVIVGVGIRVNLELAKEAGLTVENGISVDASARTNDKDIYAIGDCTFHHNPHYDRFIRLESVQNAVDQAKVAAASICGKNPVYNAIPWFWSDQYDIKLQIVGLSEGSNKTVLRKEEGEGVKFSIWYFKDDRLLAVDAVNNPKAYVLGTKFIKTGNTIDQIKLKDPTVDFKPANLLLE